MKAIVEAVVTYCCELSTTDAEKVEDLAIEKDISLEMALEELYSEFEIDLWGDSDEIDFRIDSIIDVED